MTGKRGGIHPLRFYPRTKRALITEHSILVKDASGRFVACHTMIRIAVRTPEENRSFVALMSRTVDEEFPQPRSTEVSRPRKGSQIGTARLAPRQLPAAP